MNKSATADIKKLSFEEALGELESIVNTIETGKVSLENTMSLYKRGVQLKGHCDSKLKDATLEVEKIAQ
jgi:exodeoxyribonuclease VII small subunit